MLYYMPPDILTYGVTCEVRTPLGYSLDVVVSLLDGREVAVEVDGPAHFFGQVHMYVHT